MIELKLTDGNKYGFKIGDYVETTDGEIGYIDYICHCEQCKERGFYEPRVHYKKDDDFISYSDYKNGFKFYKRIGKYEFGTSTSNKSKIENINIHTNTSGEILMVDKLNEIIDYINKGDL